MVIEVIWVMLVMWKVNSHPWFTAYQSRPQNHSVTSNSVYGPHFGIWRNRSSVQWTLFIIMSKLLYIWHDIQLFSIFICSNDDVIFSSAEKLRYISNVYIGRAAWSHRPQDFLLWDNAEVRCQKKITVLFGNFSQMADPPPHPPLLGTPYSKKNFIVYFAF